MVRAPSALPKQHPPPEPTCNHLPILPRSSQQLLSPDNTIQPNLSCCSSHLPPSHLRLSLRLAGVTTEEQLLSPDNSIHPDAYMDSLAGLLEVKPVTA